MFSHRKIFSNYWLWGTVFVQYFCLQDSLLRSVLSAASTRFCVPSNGTPLACHPEPLMRKQVNRFLFFHSRWGCRRQSTDENRSQKPAVQGSPRLWAPTGECQQRSPRCSFQKTQPDATHHLLCFSERRQHIKWWYAPTVHNDNVRLVLLLLLPLLLFLFFCELLHHQKGTKNGNQQVNRRDRRNR